MSRVSLCTGNYAQKPYRVSNLCINVYCVEELCYLFVSNPFLLTSQIMDKALVDWLDKQCDLTDLAHQLMELLKKGTQTSTFVQTIIGYVNYCSTQEEAKLQEVLIGNAGLNDYERRKKQADYLLAQNRFRLALEEYEGICQDLPDTESALKPSIYHNMGVAYTGFFLFEGAAKYFKRAYEMTRSEESGIQYLAALRLFLKENAYIDFIAAHPEYHDLSLKVEKKIIAARDLLETSESHRMLSTLKIYKEEGNAASYYEEMDKVVMNLKDGYRQLVGD